MPCAEPAKGREVISIFAVRFSNSTSNVRLVPGGPTATIMSLGFFCAWATRFLLSFAPHVPGQGTDQLFFVLDNETELFIKSGVFKFVGFKVTGKPLSPQTLQIAEHKNNADPLA